MPNDTNKRTIFTGMQVLLEHKWVKQQAIVTEGHAIKAILPDEMISHHMPATIHRFSEDHYLVPGFIDLHVHGANGKDVMDGTEEALKTISRALAGEGVTGFLATTMTAPDEKIEVALIAVADYKSHKEGAAILGVHLEGPFIAKAKLGAQPNYEKNPDIVLLQKWLKLSRDTIKIVTLAPELPDAIAFIKYLHKQGIIASIGHTDANYDETEAAIAAGYTQATHLFNAMRGITQREPGATGALLLSDKIHAELIVDQWHLHPAITDLVLRVKQRERLLLVTDAIRAKCLGDGKYELAGQEIIVQQGKATLENGTLAGSTLRMPQAIKNMKNFSHCSLIDAIEMASYNPAHVLGLDLHKGTIEVGKDADLAVLNANFENVMTMREGEVVFRR